MNMKKIIPFFEKNSLSEHNQRGMTLPSMLVGLVISVMVVLSLLTLYKQSITTSTASNQSTIRATKITTGLISASNNLQKAGFGINYVSAATINSNLIIVANANLNSSSMLSGTAQTSPSVAGVAPIGNAIVWGWTEPSTNVYSCSGLIIVNGQLIALTTSSCASATNWSSIVWSQTPLIASGLLTGSQFSGSYTACAPFNYGTQVTAPLISVQLNYKNADTSTLTNTLVSQVCMNNF